MTDTTTPPAKQWAIVELMGHARIAGAISAEIFGGVDLVRIDVPQVTTQVKTWRNGGGVITTRTIPAHSSSLGSASVYRINWCDELAATAAATVIQHEPISPYSLRSALNSLPEEDQHRLLALTAGSTANAEGNNDAHGF